MDVVFGTQELEEARWLIARALAEDLPTGDLTTAGLLAEPGVPGPRIRAALAARRPGVLCGLPVVEELFRSAAPTVELAPRAPEGGRLEAGTAFLEVSGPAPSILSLERIALNFIQRLSGIATATRAWVDALTGTGARVFDTRKTTPGWRRLEKYAVRTGGGENHRSSLSDGILVKDNHAAILRGMGRGSIPEWVEVLRRAHPEVFLQVEVDSPGQFLEALGSGADSILLDNFSLQDLRWAVERRNERGGKSPHSPPEGAGPSLEASGGLRLENAREVAATGVERISVGALTHSAPALDVGLDLLEVSP